MKLTAKIYKGEKFYIARGPELGVTTQGRTAAEARRNLKSAMLLHLRSMAEYAIKHGSVKVEHGHIVKA